MPIADTRELLVDVFIDKGLELTRNPRVRLSTLTVDFAKGFTSSRLKSVGVLLIGPRLSEGTDALPTIREIRNELPHLVIVLCVHWSEARNVALARWTRAGIDDLVTLSDSRDIGEVMLVVSRHAIAPPPAQEILWLRRTRTRSWELEAVLHLLRNAYSDVKVPSLAHRFGYSQRAFRLHLAAAGYPSPQDVSRLGRFLKIAELAERGIIAPIDIARRLGFISATEMRKTRWRFRETIKRQNNRELGRLVADFPRLLAILDRKAET